MIINSLAYIMGKKKITCRDLVKLTKLDNHTVKKLYNGTTSRIELETLDKLCYALECTPNDILKYKPD